MSFFFRIPGSVLSSHPLVLTALSSLNSELLSEASVNGRKTGKIFILFFLNIYMLLELKWILYPGIKLGVMLYDYNGDKKLDYI